MRLAPFLALAVLGLAAAACAAGEPPAPAPPAIGDAGSLARGRAYAEDACSSCHAIAAGETASPDPYATPFEVIANTPGMTGLALNVWLHSPHPNMPHLIVDPDHVDDLWAYMRSLERPPPGGQR